MIRPDSDLSRTSSPAPLNLNERVRACCTIAADRLDVGDYDAACAVLQPWWSVGDWPKISGLAGDASAELLLTAGRLTGRLSGSRRIQGGQKAAEVLLSGSIALFEQIDEPAKAAEAKVELAYCYYRQGLFDVARSTLMVAIAALPPNDTELRVTAL